MSSSDSSFSSSLASSLASSPAPPAAAPPAGAAPPVGTEASFSLPSARTYEMEELSMETVVMAAWWPM